MFTAALFTIDRSWKQPRCPSTDEWIKKLWYRDFPGGTSGKESTCQCKKVWYIYTMEYYSDIKRNTFESVLMRWMNLETIIESEVSQKEKDKYHILMHIYGI